jgi:pSer/pThr/pTyr-binding forkhead associated (FHA) protein
VITADRSQFEQVGGVGMTFPEDVRPRALVLQASELHLGRGDPAAGLRTDIDLSMLAGDPGVSRLHATFFRREDGSCSVVDRGSTNGTRVNDNPAPIPVEVPVRLESGDRARMGAWTVVIVQRLMGA